MVGEALSFNDRCQEAADNLRARPHLLADLPHTRAVILAMLDSIANGDPIGMPDSFRDMTRELRDAR